MTFEIVITLLVVAGVLVLFTTTRFDTDVILVGAMVLIVLLGVLTPDQALQGFASPGVPHDRRAVRRRRRAARNRRHGVDIALGARQADSRSRWRRPSSCSRPGR